MSDKRPICALCHVRESTVYCSYHRKFFDAVCADLHERERERMGDKLCYWVAAVPLRMLPAQQLPLAFL
jgi:hypothetical protein